jgi:hypothetical protein
MEQLEKQQWISVGEKLPKLREQVFVLGQLDDSIPICSSGNEAPKQKPLNIWITKRADCANYTDGNGFIRLYPYGQFIITHWFPIPQINGIDVYPTLPE